MHELSLIQSMFEELETISRENRLCKITDIHLNVGEISGVDIDFLKSTYELFVPETKWADIKLHLKFIPWVIQCNKCNLTQPVQNLNNRCQACGDTSTKTVQGQEFTIQRVEGEGD
jgi:hydrogenase nickel insertion protein HypA